MLLVVQEAGDRPPPYTGVGGGWVGGLGCLNRMWGYYLEFNG
jgi:hypothetical protein